LILLGTGPFAVPTFEKLYALAGWNQIAALVTAPLRLHRGKEVEPPSPLRRIALEHGTPILDPQDINAADVREQLKAFAADLLVVCDYGQILKPETLAVARLGGINLHASLLPKYRGAAPINWAIYHGETRTGVSVIYMTPDVDAGPCIRQAETPIEPEETAVELEARLAELGANVVFVSVGLLELMRVMPAVVQDPALASKAPRLKKTDGAIDWSRGALAIKNQIRALEPWPKTYTFWHRDDGPPLRLILGPVRVLEPLGEPPADGPIPGFAKAFNREWFGQPPGTVLVAAEGQLLIAAGQGAVAPQSIQPTGKRMMSIEEFLRGHHIQPATVERFYQKFYGELRVTPGDRFGPESG
jgi:methionyl-tRNA formyltransferase